MSPFSEHQLVGGFKPFEKILLKMASLERRVVKNQLVGG